MNASKREINPLTNEQKAYIAGIIDGEGSIFIRKSNQDNYYSTVSVTNTSLALFDWLIETTGFKGYLKKNKETSPERRRTRRQSWTWRLSSARETVQLLEAIRVHLVIKQDQADKAIEFHHLPDQAHKAQGAKYHEQLKEMHRAGKRYTDEPPTEGANKGANSFAGID